MPRARPGSLGAALLEGAASSGLPLAADAGAAAAAPNSSFGEFLARQAAFMQVRDPGVPAVHPLTHTHVSGPQRWVCLSGYGSWRCISSAHGWPLSVTACALVDSWHAFLMQGMWPRMQAEAAPS